VELDCKWLPLAFLSFRRAAPQQRAFLDSHSRCLGAALPQLRSTFPKFGEPIELFWRRRPWCFHGPGGLSNSRGFIQHKPGLGPWAPTGIERQFDPARRVFLFNRAPLFNYPYQSPRHRKTGLAIGLSGLPGNCRSSDPPLGLLTPLFSDGWFAGRAGWFNGGRGRWPAARHGPRRLQSNGKEMESRRVRGPTENTE